VRLALSTAEYERRLDLLREIMEQHDLDGMCLFSALRIGYFAGFTHTQTERPIVLIVPRKGELSLLAPKLEEDHVRAHVPLVKNLKTYWEYPGRTHPMIHLVDLLNELGLATARLGVDSDGYGAVWGYKGPSLSGLQPDVQLENLQQELDNVRMLKSEEEIALIRESVKWGNLIHTIIHKLIEPGKSEIEISLDAVAEASRIMLMALGPSYRGVDNGTVPAQGGLVAGPKTALPHPIDDARPLHEGDVIISWGSSVVGGYESELERTMILGKPTDEQRRYFELMVGAQDAALAAIEPGVPCSRVDEAVLDFARQHDIEGLLRHHSGHGKGLQIHEAPFFDQGDGTIIQPGMVFSCEPGLYVPGVGGFRHSETVVVTEEGAEILTYYPRDLESLTIPIR